MKVTDQIPAGLVYVDGSANNGGVLKDGVITWTVDTLEAGKHIQLIFKVTVPAVDKDTLWTNVATFVHNDEPTESNKVEVEQKPEKTPEKPPVTPPATPQTGDSFNPGLFVSLMILSSFGIAAMIVCKNKEEKEETAQ